MTDHSVPLLDKDPIIKKKFQLSNGTKGMLFMLLSAFTMGIMNVVSKLLK